MSVSQEGAREAVIEAITAVGMHAVEPDVPNAAEDFVAAEAGGRPVSIHVKAVSTLDVGAVMRLSPKFRAPGVRPVLRMVVADRVTSGAREMLRDTGWGWLDLRGHMHLVGEGLFVDADVPALRRQPHRPDAFSGMAGREVACRLLMRPTDRTEVRGIARDLGRAPSTVSEIIKALRARGLIDTDGRPIVPALFWEVSEWWQAPRQAVQQPPPTDDAVVESALRLGLDNVETTTGWALTDSAAAAAYGAPIGLRADYAPDFYIPTDAVTRRALRLLGTADDASNRGASVRVAPVRLVCDRRVDARRDGIADTAWPLAHPLFVALDLAADPSRGREVLAGWTPPEPWHRVW